MRCPARPRRRAKQACIKTKLGCHTFRATGITIYLTNGGDLEKAQQIAAYPKFLAEKAIST